MTKPSKAQERLSVLEKEIKKRGVRLAYERLQFAGLRLKSGLCWFRGEYFIFVDRLKTLPERIELLSGAMEELDELAAKGLLEHPVPEPEPEPDTPQMSLPNPPPTEDQA